MSAPTKDTELFRKAVEDYRSSSGDNREFFELPTAVRSKILAHAQDLKADMKAGKKPNHRRNWMGAQRASQQFKFRAEEDRRFKAARKSRKRLTRESEDAVDAHYDNLRKSARAALPKASGGRVGGKKQLNELFHELYGRNPMPGKKKKKRKGKMPAALKAYWAAKRRQKNGRKKAAKRTVRAKPRKRAVAKRRVRNYRPRPAAAPKRRMRRNPPVKRPTKLRLNVSLGPKAKRSLASFIRRATGRRVRVQ